MEPLVIPDDLSALSDDELAALAGEVTERATQLQDDAVIEEAGAEAVNLIENAIAADEAVSAEQAKREEAAAEQAQILAETRERLAKRLNPEDEPEAEVEPEAAEEEPETEPVAEEEPEAEPEATPVEAEPEPVLAAAKRRPAPRRAKEHEPASADGGIRGVKMMALTNLPGEIEGGQQITRKQVAKLVSEKWNRMSKTGGPREDYPLVRYSVDFPEERMLHYDDEVGNGEKIKAVVGPEALVASGGLCAPVEPYYDLQLLSTEATPVIDSLPLFGADRGGIRFMAPPTLANISTAVGVMTAANDAIGGTTATKTCQSLPCPAQTQVLIDAVYHCLTIGNFGNRAWPELVENFTGLMMAAHARVRETKALDAIKAGSTAVTGAQYNGAANTLLAEINAITDGFRSRHRMDPNARFRAWFPEWVKGLLLTDLERGQFNRFDRDRNGVVELIRAAGVEPTFFVDGETGGGQVFGTQGAGAYLNYPSTVKWYIAPEGTWIRLNGGELDLGIVRDSVLNATNDFQMFGEVFENYAKIGIESLAVTSTVCANGVVSAPAAPSGC
jgi:hypothetical protein